ncbi:hypothetical protein [Dictyobacter kobayashii]|nr:hypothetical protein [Dictyobacter kobayashii]
MSHVPETQPEQTAAVRSEHMLAHIGENIGSFAAHSSQRLQHFTRRISNKRVSQIDKSQTPQEPAIISAETSPETQQPPLEKAEATLDTMQERIALVTTVAELQFRHTVARIREGAEDMLAEAQHIRHDVHSGERNRPVSHKGPPTQ